MNWIPNSPLRSSIRRSNRNPLATASECDPKACYDSFCKHWQQVYEIILRVEPNKPSKHDDVLGVVNNLDHMVTLLLVELHNCNKVNLPGIQPPPAQCLEFLLSENLLDKLYEWGITTGRYANAVRLEQMKLYELLVSHSRHQLLVHEPFLRPLLKLLASSQGEIFPPDIEKRLVILLNQLCVVLMQNVHLLDLFFFSSPKQDIPGNTNFIIFSLLIPYIHREGSLGHQARDALLLCMSLSQKNSNVGTYIAKYSSMCPFLVTGLGGSYSSLPNSIEITATDWHRITPDDVAEIPELTLFMNSLEFCNAVVQVAHELIRQQLLDFMYQGFIMPILGPALLQIFKGNTLQNNAESQISAMAYLDLILRSVTEPGLLKIFIQFLLVEEKFDGQRMLDILIDRFNSADTKLCMVTFSLLDTLLSLNCEDIMLELLLKYLLPCRHIPTSHRHKVNQVDFYSLASDHFLDLSAEVMRRSMSIDMQIEQSSPVVSKTIGANWNHYGLHTGESLYSNYHAYLFDVRQRIALCQRACENWSNAYRFENVLTNKRSERTMELIRNYLSEFIPGYGSDADRAGKQMDSLQSIGESSGYESFKYRPDEELPEGEMNGSSSSNGMPEAKRKLDSWRVSSRKQTPEVEQYITEDPLRSQVITLGPFISAIWSKLQTFTSNCLYVNLQLTGLITRLACYPLPLVHTLFLRPDIPTTTDIPSFYQVLKILKQQIDAELPVNEECLELVDVARSTLVEREIRLVNMRKTAIENSRNPGRNGVLYNEMTTANISAATPPQATATIAYDPFRRGDTKRQSLTKSISNMFRKASLSGNSSSGGAANNANVSSGSTASSGLMQIFELFTGGSNILNNIQMRETNIEPSSLDSIQSAGSGGGSIGSGSITSSNDRLRDLAVCAVILDEWLKELSAISHEQSIAMLSNAIN